MSAFAYQRADHMLSEQVTLLDPSGRGQHVRNVETLCRDVLNRAVVKSWPNIEEADYDESLGTLLAESIVQHGIYSRRHAARTEAEIEEYRQRYGRPPVGFGPWLEVQLWRRLIDFWRSFYGRHGQKRVPFEILGPRGGGPLDGSDFHDGDPDGDRLERVRPGDPTDPADDWVATGGGLLATRDQPGAWHD